jgi:hypothetical protein
MIEEKLESFPYDFKILLVVTKFKINKNILMISVSEGT